MNRAGITLGLVVLIGLAVVGYLLLDGTQTEAPVSAEATLEPAPEPERAPPEAASSQVEPIQPAAPAQRPAPAPAPVEAGRPAVQPLQEPAKPAQASPEPAPAVQPLQEPAPQARPSSQPAPAIEVARRAPPPATQEPAAIAPAPAQGLAAVPPVQDAGPGAPAAAPSFDVLRVEPSGEAVIAGRAAPGSQVTLMDDTTPLGRATADWRGQWVIVPEAPLAPGDHELSLEARSGAADAVLSQDVVVVSVPAPSTQVAAAAPPAAPVAEAARPAPSPAPPAPERAQAAPAPAARSVPAEAEAPTRRVAEAAPERPLAVLMPRGGQGPIRVLQAATAPSEGLGEGTLVLETVDYDARGMASVGGRAEPGSRLVVYLDDRPVGDTRAGADRRWSLVIERPVAEGLHRLRIDQVDGAGRVLARVETPFSRAAMVAALPDEAAVIVQPGNSLWRIARRVYGRGLHYTVIYEANQGQIRDPDLIYPGQIFALPTGESAARP